MCSILGHVVSQGDVAPVATKVEAILNFPAPTDKHEVMRSIGMVGYNHKFCCNFSVVTEPLTSLLQKRENFAWSEEWQQAFEKIKSLLLPAPALKVPDFEKPFKLQVDASEVGIEAILLQESNQGIDYPVSYYLKKFNNHQNNFSTSEKEAFTLLSALQNFDVYLGVAVAPIEGFTDHNLLVFIHKMKNNNQRLLSWSLALQEYCFIFRHMKGKDNVIVDSLLWTTGWSTEWHWLHANC